MNLKGIILETKIYRIYALTTYVKYGKILKRLIINKKNNRIYFSKNQP